MVRKIAEGDRLQMKKKHPCGRDLFDVLRVGSDLRIRCAFCGRDLTLPRAQIEKNIKRITGKEETK